MDNYEYSPQELKIIVDIANKRDIPIFIGKDSIMALSRWSFKPLIKFSINGFSPLVELDFNNIDYCLNYCEEIIDYLKIFMQEQVTIKS
jgi:hypothetical protein